MNMAEDQVDETVKGESFGTVMEREAGDEGNESEVEKPETETTETESNDNQEETQGESEDNGTAEETESEETEGEEPELTEKGTKKDPNPQSAIHQEAANAKKALEQIDQVLANPELRAKFLKDRYGVDEVPGKPEDKVETATEGTEGEPEEPIKEYKAEDFENLDDVAKVVNGLQKGFADKTKNLVEETKKANQKIEKLTGIISSIVDGGRRQVVANNISQGVSSLSKEPELDPQNPDYIEGLENKIAARFNQLDYDPVNKAFKGDHSIEEVGKEFLDAIRMGRKSGSQKAQTIVKDKTAGKIKENVKASDEIDTEEMKPGESIAAGIAKMARHIR